MLFQQQGGSLQDRQNSVLWQLQMGGGGVMIFSQFELSLVSPGLLCPGIIAGFSEPMGGGG